MQCWRVKNVLHSLSFISGSNEAILMFLKRDFQDQKAQVLRLKLLVTVLFGTAKNPFILKQDERSIQMDNNNR